MVVTACLFLWLCRHHPDPVRQPAPAVPACLTYREQVQFVAVAPAVALLRGEIPVSSHASADALAVAVLRDVPALAELVVRPVHLLLADALLCVVGLAAVFAVAPAPAVVAALLCCRAQLRQPTHGFVVASLLPAVSRQPRRPGRPDRPSARRAPQTCAAYLCP